MADVYIAFFAALFFSSSASGATPAPPNFLVILLDDVGFGDFSAYSSRFQDATLDDVSKQSKSPHIDKIATWFVPIKHAIKNPSAQTVVGHPPY
jgi:hypothetical protein